MIDKSIPVPSDFWVHFLSLFSDFEIPVLNPSMSEIRDFIFLTGLVGKQKFLCRRFSAAGLQT